MLASKKELTNVGERQLIAKEGLSSIIREAKNSPPSVLADVRSATASTMHTALDELNINVFKTILSYDSDIFQTKPWLLEAAAITFVGKYFQDLLNGRPLDSDLIGSGVNYINTYAQLLRDPRDFIGRDCPKGISDQFGSEVALTYIENINKVSNGNIDKPYVPDYLNASFIINVIDQGEIETAREYFNKIALSLDLDQELEIRLKLLGADIERDNIQLENASLLMRDLRERAKRKFGPFDNFNFEREVASMVTNIVAGLKKSQRDQNIFKIKLDWLKSIAETYIIEKPSAKISAYLTCSSAYRSIGEEKAADDLFANALKVFDQGKFLGRLDANDSYLAESVFSKMIEILLNQGDIKQVEEALGNLEKLSRFMDSSSWNNLLASWYAELSNYIKNSQKKHNLIKKAIKHHTYSVYPDSSFLTNFSSDLSPEIINEVLDLAKQMDLDWRIKKPDTGERLRLNILFQVADGQQLNDILPRCLEEINKAYKPLNTAIPIAELLCATYPQEASQIIESLILPCVNNALETLFKEELDEWEIDWEESNYNIWGGLLIMGRSGKENLALKTIDNWRNKVNQKLEEAKRPILAMADAIFTDGVPDQIKLIRKLSEEFLPGFLLSCQAAIYSGVLLGEPNYQNKKLGDLI